MGNKKSKAAGKSNCARKSDQTSILSKGAIEQSLVNTRMVQNVLLIWLDNNIDLDNSNDCRNTVAQLRSVVNTVKTFSNSDECFEFIKTINDDKACMIISGSLGQHVVSRVHLMSQVDSIFIFCSNKKHHEQWVKEWPKIKDVFTEITSICEALKHVASQCEHNAVSISFMGTNDDTSKKKLDQLDCSFMYTQILKEILLSIRFEQKHIQEYIDYCRDAFADNNSELEDIKQFEREYHDRTPVWWYTYDCFLYPMLNRALRTMEVDMIIKMGFFISDLQHQIEQLHFKQFTKRHKGKKFTVYRGQGLSKADFEQMIKTNGGLLAFNNFLSTSKNRSVSLDFADRAAKNPDLVGILFIMKIDPSASTTPFASINGVGYYEDKEDEVLFAMHTVFRIRNIKPMDGNPRLVQVDLKLTSDDDRDLRVLTSRMREDTFPDKEGWERLGLVLFKIGQSDDAEQVYQFLLEQTTKDNEKACIYHQLGFGRYNQGEYTQAIQFYKDSMEIEEKLIPLNHINLANSHIGIGNAYHSVGDNLKALDSYEKALKFQQQSLPPNHLDLADSYNNIGAVYVNMYEYSKALLSHEKALTIRQQSLPPNHPDLAKSYNNIGNVYCNMHDCSKALSSYEKALAIQQKSLPSNHPDWASTYNNIGVVNHKMGNNSNALLSFEKALVMRQQSLPPNHPDLGVSYNNIGAVYDSMRDHSKARSFYERAVDSGQHSLPPYHPTLKQWQKNLEDVTKKL